MKRTKLPERGVVFWPVGTGDATTLLLDAETIMQIDLHHTAKSENDGEDEFPVVDELLELLPERDGRPYLSVFVLTHPDEDHIKGFAKLLEEATIGEIWHTPRVFREYKKDLCDDALAFREEVERRRDIVIESSGDPGPGDRVRLVGHDELLEDEAYEGFPDSMRVVPGQACSCVDSRTRSNDFRAFIHAPFKDNSSGERNETSLAMQVKLQGEGGDYGELLLCGDLSYPTLERIFTKTAERGRSEYLSWNVFLAPHHCSKSAMYWKGEGDDEEQRKEDILEMLEASASAESYIIASCASFRDEDSPGDNPPHRKARQAYEELVAPGHFLCTAEHGDPVCAIVFELSGEGLQYRREDAGTEADGRRLSEAITGARGAGAPPSHSVGFGAAGGNDE